jgi:hypothetical protein
LPLPLPARADLDLRRVDLEPRLAAGDIAAHALVRVLKAQGQTFLAAVAEILERPETQEVVNRTLNAIGRYFARGAGGDALRASAHPTVANVCQMLEPELEAAACLARVSADQVAVIFARSSAIGSLMRRKIEPVVTPLLADIRLLRGDQ